VTNNISNQLYYERLVDNLKENMLILKCYPAEEREDVLTELLQNIVNSMREDLSDRWEKRNSQT